MRARDLWKKLIGRQRDEPDQVMGHWGLKTDYSTSNYIQYYQAVQQSHVLLCMATNMMSHYLCKASFMYRKMHIACAIIKCILFSEDKRLPNLDVTQQEITNNEQVVPVRERRHFHSKTGYIIFSVSIYMYCILRMLFLL